MYNEIDRNAMILQYSPLVKYIASRIYSSIPDNSVDLSDLINTGILGLIDAINKFEIERGIPFKNYAETRIRGEILDSLRHLDWLPKSIRKYQKDIDKAIIILQSKKGREPTDKEISDYLGVSLEEYHKLIYKTKGISLSYFSEWSSSDFDDSIIKTKENTRSPDPVKCLERKELIEILAQEMDNLSNQEKMVLSLYYYNELTLKEIGKVLDISESRVSQIRTKTLYKIKKKLLGRNIQSAEFMGEIANG